MYLLVPLYVLAMVLTFFSTEEFVNIAWDSAGVTIGPVTVPLVPAMGLGLGEAVNVIEGTISRWPRSPPGGTEHRIMDGFGRPARLATQRKQADE